VDGRSDSSVSTSASTTLLEPLLNAISHPVSWEQAHVSRCPRRSAVTSSPVDCSPPPGLAGLGTEQPEYLVELGLDINWAPTIARNRASTKPAESGRHHRHLQHLMFCCSNSPAAHQGHYHLFIKWPLAATPTNRTVNVARPHHPGCMPFAPITWHSHSAKFHFRLPSPLPPTHIDAVPAHQLRTQTEHRTAYQSPVSAQRSRH
jgi:hypothetical protein